MEFVCVHCNRSLCRDEMLLHSWRTDPKGIEHQLLACRRCGAVHDVSDDLRIVHLVITLLDLCRVMRRWIGGRYRTCRQVALYRFGIPRTLLLEMVDEGLLDRRFLDIDRGTPASIYSRTTSH